MIPRIDPAKSRAAFTLIELLVVIAVIALLVTLTAGGVGRSLEQAKARQCMSKMGTLGQAIHLYATDHRGEFPRSLHSAGAHRQSNWAQAILPYLGTEMENPNMEQWAAIFERYFRCPNDPSTDPMIYSYGLNVHFELDPAGDSYTGAPRQWRTLTTIARPTRSILLAEVHSTPFGDHVMSHLWNTPAAARNAIANDRHQGKSHYVFVDGSVRGLKVEETFDPAENLNLWNPSLAR